MFRDVRCNAESMLCIIHKNSIHQKDVFIKPLYRDSHADIDSSSVEMSGFGIF